MNYGVVALTHVIIDRAEHQTQGEYKYRAQIHGNVPVRNVWANNVDELMGRVAAVLETHNHIKASHVYMDWWA